jgi:ankyrin repeat protein
MPTSNVETVRLLLENGASNSDALSTACRTNSIEIVKVLLEFDIDLTDLDKEISISPEIQELFTEYENSKYVLK